MMVRPWHMLVLLLALALPAMRVLVARLASTASNEPQLPRIALPRAARIAIVGGGPAGVHMASVLAKKGFTNITLLEAEDRVGGKVHTVFVEGDDVPHDMAAAYVSPPYFPLIKPLLAEYNPSNKLVGVDVMANPDAWWVMGEDVAGEASSGDGHGASSSGMDMAHYYIALANVNSGYPADSWRGYVSFPAALMRLMWLHFRIFGPCEYGVPPRPADWSAIDMSALEFLQRHDLMALEGLFRTFYQGLGYGTLEESHALFLLWLFHPSQSLSVLAGMFGLPFSSMLSEGFQTLFLHMAHRLAADGLVDVRTNSQVLSVTRGNVSKLTYLDRLSGSNVTLEADIVIMAVDVRRFLHLIKDVAVEEEEIFSGFDSSLYASTLYDSTPMQPVERPTLYWPKHTAHDPDGARVYAIRNDRNLLRGGKSRYTDGTHVYGNITGRQRRSAYQIQAGGDRQDFEKWSSVLHYDLQALGQTDIHIIKEIVWPYFTHFNATTLRNGNLWRIPEIQGNRNTLWVGSSVCFESVLDVLVHNTRLAQRLILV